MRSKSHHLASDILHRPRHLRTDVHGAFFEKAMLATDTERTLQSITAGARGRTMLRFWRRGALRPRSALSQRWHITCEKSLGTSPATFHIRLGMLPKGPLRLSLKPSLSIDTERILQSVITGVHGRPIPRRLRRGAAEQRDDETHLRSTYKRVPLLRTAILADASRSSDDHDCRRHGSRGR